MIKQNITHRLLTAVLIVILVVVFSRAWDELRLSEEEGQATSEMVSETLVLLLAGGAQH